MAIRNVLLLLTLFNFNKMFVASTQDIVRWIESPRLTNWGDWQQEEICPPNSWVTGVNLKIEPDQCEGDDTALNGIKLTCTSTDGRDTAVITSGEYLWGFYRGTKYCSSGFATGFRLRSESDSKQNDNKAATDLILVCTHVNGTTSKIVGGGILTSGEYTEQQVCPPETAICGIKTQIQGAQGDRDDTSLNNVDFACCSRTTASSTTDPDQNVGLKCKC